MCCTHLAFPYISKAVALNCGARVETAAAFYLPLPKIARALEFLQQGEKVGWTTVRERYKIQRPMDQSSFKARLLRNEVDYTNRTRLFRTSSCIDEIFPTAVLVEADTLLAVKVQDLWYLASFYGTALEGRLSLVVLLPLCCFERVPPCSGGTIRGVFAQQLPLCRWGVGGAAESVNSTGLCKCEGVGGASQAASPPETEGRGGARIHGDAKQAGHQTPTAG